MDVVLGIAAKSLDAAYQLAKALHGPHGWARQENISLQPTPMSAPRAPEAASRLLLSHDSSTAYILVATHAPPEELLRAVASAARKQQRQQQQVAVPHAQHAPQRGGGPAASPDGSDSCGGDGDGSFVPSAPPPPLTQLQQQHAAAANAMLLQLFLVCDAVLVMLPTGQGLGLAGAGSAAGGPMSGGGGALAGVMDWICRLRLLQGAKRALCQSLEGGGGRPASQSCPSRLPVEGYCSPVRRPAAAAVAAPTPSTSATDDASGGGCSGEFDVTAQLRSWCHRSGSPPALFFVSPSDEASEGPRVPAPAAASNPRSAAHGHRATSAQRAAAAAQTDPRDANLLLRNLLKRCRPVPLFSTPDSSQLCLFEPSALVVEPGPLALEPVVVHATVLATLLEPEDGYSTTALSDSPSALSDEPSAVASGQRRGKGLHRLKEPLAAALAAAAAAREEVSRSESLATAVGGIGIGGSRSDEGVANAGTAGGAAAVRKLCVAWRAAGRELCDAALAAWRDAVGQPLDWVPPCMEGALRQAAARTATPTVLSRTGPRTAGAAAAVTPTLHTTAVMPCGQTVTFFEPAAAWLAIAATGGGLAARLAAELSREAADAALRQYTAAVPPGCYPERVHASAVAAAVATLRAAVPPGPTAAATVTWLRAACEDEWRREAGRRRRQCSALSATGRPCTRPVHDPAEPHCSETTIWVTATTTGSSLVAVPDPFDVQAINTSAELDDGARVAAAMALLPQSPASTTAAAAAAAGNAGTAPLAAGGGGGARAKGGKRGGAAAASTAVDQSSRAAPAAPPPQQQLPQHLLPAHSRHLLVAIAQTVDGSTRQCALGPWVTVTRLGPASLYNDRRGLTNQPGLNGSYMYPLTLHLETESGSGSGGQQRSGGAAGRGGGGGPRGPGGFPRVASTGSTDVADASAVSAGASDSEAGVVLDEQSFPSLAEAAAAMQGPRQQQQQLGLGSRQMGPKRGGGAKQQTGGGKVGGGADAAINAVISERERFAKAWPYPHGSSATTGRAKAGGTANRGVGGGDGGGSGSGTGGPSGRGRRGGRGGTGPSGGSDSSAFPPLSSTKDVRRVYLSYEYQTLDGRRFLATQQQLAAAAVAAAAAAGRAISRDAPSTPPSASNAPTGLQAPHQPNRKGPRPPPVSGTAGTAPTSDAAASAATAALSSSSGGGANFLLQNDAPLYLQPPPGLQLDPAAPVAQDGVMAWDPTPRRPTSLAQLRRIFVVTPPSACGEPLLATRPTVQFRVMQPPQLPRDALAAAGLLMLQREAPRGASAATCKGSGNGSGNDGGGRGDNPKHPGGGAEAVADPEGQRTTTTTNTASTRTRRDEKEKEQQHGLLAAQMVSGQGPAATAVHVSLARPVPLPPDSLVVISLPLLYGLPAEWLGWGRGLCEGGEGDGQGGSAAGADGGWISAGEGKVVTVKDAPHAQIVMGKGTRIGPDGVITAAQSGATGEGEALGCGSLLPMVQLDERTPFEARLLGSSALFPITS